MEVACSVLDGCGIFGGWCLEGRGILGSCSVMEGRGILGSCSVMEGRGILEEALAVYWRVWHFGGRLQCFGGVWHIGEATCSGLEECGIFGGHLQCFVFWFGGC